MAGNSILELVDTNWESENYTDAIERYHDEMDWLFDNSEYFPEIKEEMDQLEELGRYPDWTYVLTSKNIDAWTKNIQMLNSLLIVSKKYKEVWESCREIWHESVQVVMEMMRDDEKLEQANKKLFTDYMTAQDTLKFQYSYVEGHIIFYSTAFAFDKKEEIKHSISLVQVVDPKGEREHFKCMEEVDEKGIFTKKLTREVLEENLVISAEELGSHYNGPEDRGRYALLSLTCELIKKQNEEAVTSGKTKRLWGKELEKKVLEDLRKRQEEEERIIRKFEGMAGPTDKQMEYLRIMDQVARENGIKIGGLGEERKHAAACDGIKEESRVEPSKQVFENKEKGKKKKKIKKWPFVLAAVLILMLGGPFLSILLRAPKYVSNMVEGQKQEVADQKEEEEEEKAKPVVVPVSRVRVTGESVNIRSGPSKSTDKLGTVYKGSDFELAEEGEIDQSKDQWIKIIYEGKEGYVYSKYIEIIPMVLEADGSYQVYEEISE